MRPFRSGNASCTGFCSASFSASRTCWAASRSLMVYPQKTVSPGATSLRGLSELFRRQRVSEWALARPIQDQNERAARQHQIGIEGVGGEGRRLDREDAEHHSDERDQIGGPRLGRRRDPRLAQGWKGGGRIAQDRQHDGGDGIAG